MARAKKDPNAPKKEKKADSEKSDFIKALEFVCLNQRDEGNPGQTNCMFADGFIMTADGITSLGYPVVSTLDACPQSKRLLTALQRAKGAYSLTQLDASNLTLQAGKFRANIPTLPLETLALPMPDAICYSLSNEFRTALEHVAILASDSGDQVYKVSVLCKNNSVFSCDGVSALEYYHGLPFPEMVIPKTFITMLSKIKMNIVSFGFSSGSLTIYFENGAWIKTQTFADKYPDVESLLNNQCEAKPLPPAFKEALLAIAPFADGDGNRIYIGDTKIKSHKNESIGASIDFKSDQQGCFDCKRLLQLVDYIKTIDFRTNSDRRMALFYGNNIRGALCQVFG